MDMWIFIALTFTWVFQGIHSTVFSGIEQKSTHSTTMDYNVTCSPKRMTVTVNVNSSTTLVYLERLKSYPGCEPEWVKDRAIFRLPLDNIYQCGTTRILNKLTGVKIYYHRIVVEEHQREKQLILISCNIPPSHNYSEHLSFKRKRNVFPENFSEPEYINITDYIVANAPVPYLNLLLRQQGRILDTTQTVQPGTLLQMIVYLDPKSAADTYGLLTSYLMVTDSSPHQEEIIIMNGCSIDPYIFSNFEYKEDLLTATFRAFKFPEANYVFFVGTVSVCLSQCKGVPCGNNQLGYGRRKRNIPTDLPSDSNKIFEVEMTAVLKVQDVPDSLQLSTGTLKSNFATKEEATEKKATSIVVNKAFKSQFSLFWTSGSLVIWMIITIKISAYR